MPHRESKVFAPGEEPDVEVLYRDEDGVETWCPGELRMWVPVGDDAWEGTVVYRRPGQTSSPRDGS